MAQSTQRLILAEDLYQFQLITGCELAPDGRYIIFPVQRVDRATEKKYTNLWLAPTDGRPARQFTYGDQSDRQPQWSPDSRFIAFLSNRKDEKQPQLYIIPVDGGEARPLTDLKGSIASFRWSPDGRRLVCAFRRKDAEALAREDDEQK
jgi:dipeptidyl aminopeptidase/acylaminoacyl peptidase